jgi:hypothetical protein
MIPPIQFALLNGIVSASLLFALIQIVKNMNLESRDRPNFILAGKSVLWAISFSTVTWLLTAFYIALFGALCQVTLEPVEKGLWTLSFIGCLYGSITIFGLLYKGDFKSYLKH